MSRIPCLALLLAMGCASATRVDVYFEADADLEAAAQGIEITVEDTEGDVVLSTVESLGAQRSLPVAVRLEPEGGDASRSFFVVGRLLDGGTRIARVAAVGRYFEGESRELRLRFTAGCGAGLDCADRTTCRAGRCEDACVAELGACGGLDGGLDAGPEGDAGDGDAGPGDDAARPDAGEHTPAYLQRVVPRFDTATPSTYVSALSTPLMIDASAGPWLVLASGGLTSTSSAASAVAARLMVDGTEAVLGSSHVDDDSGAGPWSGFAFLDGGRTHSVDVELNAFVGGGSTASFVDLRVVVFPLPSGAAVYRQQALANVLFLASEGWRDFAELRFTPTSTGRHLVLGQISVTRLPSISGYAGARLQEGGGATWPVASGDPSHLSSATGDYQTFFLARAPSLTMGTEAVFRLQAMAASGNSNASHARLLAIDLSAFPATLHDEQLAAGTTTSATPDVLARADAPAGPVRDWIAIGSVTLLTNGGRGAELSAGPISRRYTHPFAGQARIPYPFFGAFFTGEAFAGTSAAFAPGPNVEHREAVVHLLGL